MIFQLSVFFISVVSRPPNTHTASYASSLSGRLSQPGVFCCVWSVYLSVYLSVFVFVVVLNYDADSQSNEQLPRSLLS